MKAEALPQGWSPLRAELWALAQALQHAKGKGVNFYTEARYAFATLHVHGAIYKERGLLAVGGKEIKKQKRNPSAVEAVWKPSQVAVIHCKGHQQGTDPISNGNRLATRQPRRQQPIRAPQWAPSQSLRSSWHQNCLHPRDKPRKKINGL